MLFWGAAKSHAVLSLMTGLILFKSSGLWGKFDLDCSLNRAWMNWLLILTQ